ncbi:LuxR C-terminal-related transcriptional regulator, partial [Bacteroidota bacterium]
AVLALLSVVFELSAYKFLKHYKTFFKRIFVFIVISYLTGIAVYIYDPEADLLEYIDTILLTSGALIVYVSLILLVFINREKKERQHAIRIFAIIYGIVFLPIAAFMFTIPFKFTILSALFIVSNLIPFIWVSRYFVKFFAVKFNTENGKSTIEEIIEKYGLTDREGEIMELIIQGKSNKEIEAALYISLNTVRNHTHNLYKKLNVNGRGQMVGLILAANRNEGK